MDTFAIITTEPNELIVEKTGHDRMPVIIRRQDYQRWLEPGSEEQPPVDLIRPFDSDKMKAWRVDRRVNNVKNNEPSLCEPIKEDTPPEKPARAEKPGRKPKTERAGSWECFEFFRSNGFQVMVQKSGVGFIETIDCLPVSKLPESPEWTYEILCADQHKISYVMPDIMWRSGCCVSQ